MANNQRLSCFVFFLFVLVVGLGGCAGKVTSTTETQASDKKTSTNTGTTTHLNASAQPDPTSVAIESLRFSDINQESHAPFADDDLKAIALVFIATDCPIANYFQPTLAKLAASYIDDGVQFYMVHPNPDLKLDAALKHAEEFAIKSPVIMDSDLTIAKTVQARVTPEAFVIDRVGNIRYRGRINDLYVDYGKKRRTPTTNDLQDAIEAVVRGNAVETIKTKAVGCYIPYPR